MRGRERAVEQLVPGTCLLLVQLVQIMHWQGNPDSEAYSLQQCFPTLTRGHIYKGY